MGKIVLAAGVPHAPQLVSPPETWPEIHELVTCASRVGRKPELEKETLEDNVRQLREAKASFDLIRKALVESKADTIVGLTDDHFDNFFLDDYPPFSIYLGDRVDGSTIWIPGKKFEFRCDTELENTILRTSQGAGFDLSFSEEVHLEYGHLVPLSYIMPEGDWPLVPFFTNAYATPTPTPARCYQLGSFLKEVIERHTAPDRRIAILASGGMSHYPGEPLGGEVDVAFDRQMMDWLRDGEGERFSRLSAQDIDRTGNTEMRNWIVMLGALGDRKPSYLKYVLSWRAIIGLGFAIWREEGA